MFALSIVSISELTDITLKRQGAFLKSNPLSLHATTQLPAVKATFILPMYLILKLNKRLLFLTFNTAYKCVI